MRVLWVVNVALPEASLLMGTEPTPFGGWLVNASESLATQDNVALSVAFPGKVSTATGRLRGGKIAFYQFPPVTERDREKGWASIRLAQILDEVDPDIVHVFGTESIHTLAVVDLCITKQRKFVVSIQGLVSVCAQHYVTGLPTAIQYRFTPRDLLRMDNVRQQRKKFVDRGKIEIEALRKTKHVIGRTTWDRACVSQINPTAEYHKCNDTMRSVFYGRSWSINTCKKYEIFASQGAYPIKGLHLLLEAMPLVLGRFPQARLYIAGPDVTGGRSVSNSMRISSYGKYIRELIRRHRLENQVVFTGVLNDKEMCDRFIKSNVFVLPSTIENSPNSLGEAMLLGVPSVASNVGGVRDLLRHGEEGFTYQVDAPYMLAHYICEILMDDGLADRLSASARLRAAATYDADVNARNLLMIYSRICDDSRRI